MLGLVGLVLAAALHAGDLGLRDDVALTGPSEVSQVSQATTLAPPSLLEQPQGEIAAGVPFKDWAPLSMVCLVALLGLGELLRESSQLLQDLYVPASLLAGVIGVVVLHLVKAASPGAHTYITENMLYGWSSLPPFLTTVIFSGLVLGNPLPSVKDVWTDAGSHLLYSLSMALGQHCVCTLLTFAVLVPAFDVSPYFAVVVPFGFEGGHGVVGGFADMFKAKPPDGVGFAPGYSMGMGAASVALFVGVCFGSFAVNWAAHQGYLEGHTEREDTETKELVRRRTTRHTLALSLDEGEELGKKLLRKPTRMHQEHKSAGRQVVGVEIMDSLTFHICLLAGSMAFGIAMKTTLALFAGKIIAAFPLFPFCLLGSLLVQALLNRLGLPVDRPTVQRVLNTAQDFLIVSGMAQVSLEEITALGPPFLLAAGAAFAWSVFGFFVLAPRMLPDFWVERGVLEIGLMMGSTASALMLLRMADPDNHTPVLQQFGFKQVVWAAFMGGGMVDASALWVIQANGLGGFLAVVSSGYAFCVALNYLKLRLGG